MQCTKLYRISALVKLISYHFDDELCFLCSTRELWMLGLLVINIHGLPGTMTPGNGWGWESLTSTPNSVLVTNRFEKQGTLILLILAPSTFAITTSASGSVFFPTSTSYKKKEKKWGVQLITWYIRGTEQPIASKSFFTTSEYALTKIQCLTGTSKQRSCFCYEISPIYTGILEELMSYFYPL